MPEYAMRLKRPRLCIFRVLLQLALQKLQCSIKPSIPQGRCNLADLPSRCLGDSIGAERKECKQRTPEDKTKRQPWSPVSQIRAESTKD